MGKWKLCVRWSATVDHPAAFRWHAASKKNGPSWCFFPFQMAPVLPLRTAWIADILSQASLRDVQRQRCWKRGSGDGQRLSLWDDGTTERSINVVDRRGSTLTWTVCKAITASAAADSEERQICTTCLIAESAGLCLMLFPIVRDFKGNAVGNVVAETGRDLVFMTTARLSDLSMPDEVRRSPEQSARQPIARSGKFVRRTLLIHGERWFVKRRRSYAFSYRGAHFCLRGGWGKTGDLTWQPAVKPQSPAAKTTNNNCCDRAMAQVKQHIPEQPGWKNSKYWANIEKRNQINTKNYWK